MSDDVIIMSHYSNKMVELYLPSSSGLNQDQIWTTKKLGDAISIAHTMTAVNDVSIMGSNDFSKTTYHLIQKLSLKYKTRSKSCH